MNDWDERLKQLVLTAQTQQSTAERQILLMQIWQIIYAADHLYRPPRDKISGNYQDIYDDALWALLEYLGRNLDKYDPERSSVIGWVNMLLERRFIREAIAKWQKEENRFVRPTLADLDGLDEFDPPAPTPDISPTQIIKQYFEEDPDGVLQSECIPSYPRISFQAIVLRHHVEGESFTKIAKAFGVPYTSLVSFYQRRLKTFAPQIRAYVNQHL